MTGERPHPHPDIEWGCPDCESVDIACLSRLGSQRGHQQPACFCYDCGIRFERPDEIEVETP